VPQLANYLVAAPALFHSGLQDMGNLHQRLGELRQKAIDHSDSGREEFFLRGLSGDYAYRSNLKPTQYGYDADIRYTAIQIGGNVYGLETDDSVLRLGFSASYGDIGFTPSRTNSQKTHLDVWNVAPYITWQHDSGMYFDLIHSYGQFDGFVRTQARGQTARLQGQTQATSMQTGMPLALNNRGLTLAPQAQLTYQRLKFDEAHDIDGFPVALGHLEQTTVSAGAELAQQLINPAAGQTITLSAQLHLTHTFNDENQAWFGDSFEVGQSGTHVKARTGIELTVGKKVHFYSDVTWQAPIGTTGTTGLSINGGFRLRF